MRVRRGVYVERERWETASRRDRALLGDVAAHLTADARHVMSHDSAVRLLGLDLLDLGEEPLAHVTRPRVAGGRTDAGVKHHRSPAWPPGPLVEVDRIPVMDGVRTVLDVGREHGYRAGLVVADQLARAGVREGDYATELAVMRCWPGIGSARRAVADADAGAENVGETLARVAVASLGIGEVETQFPVRLPGGRVVWADLRVGCHLFEFDGRVKYRRPDQGGVAAVDAGDVVWDERRRQTEVTGLGLGMSRLVWSEVAAPRLPAATRRRLLDEVAVTLRRFGPHLPEHLATDAARLRARAPRRTA